MIIPAGYAHCVLTFTGDSLPLGGAVTFGVQNSGIDPVSAVLTAVEDAIATAQLEAMCVASVTLDLLRIKLGPNATGDFGESVLETVGTSLGVQGSPNTAMLVKKVTLLGGRKGRGRMYWPGLAELVIEADGDLDAGFRGDAQGIWDSFITELTANNVPMVVLHNDATTPTVVQDLIVDDRCATQRRRLRK